MVIVMYAENQRISHLHQEYSKVETEDEIYGRIIHVRTKKGTSFITIESGKYMLDSHRNPVYKREYMTDHISVGDSIFKHQNNDTIVIMNDEETMYFIHWKVSNL